MELPYELLIGWRYTRAGRRARRNGFISFISFVSIAGIALGVAALIVVISVMNGFQQEVRQRMLGVLPHIQVLSADGGALGADWPQLQQRIAREPDVTGVAPFVSGQALLAQGSQLYGVLAWGIVPADETRVSSLGRHMVAGSLDALRPGGFGVVLGDALARNLGAGVGDQVTMVVPSASLTPAGMIPRLRTLRVVGIFHAGHYEYDSSLALLDIGDAERLFLTTGPTGLRVQTRDADRAPLVAQQLQALLPAADVAQPWTEQNRTWFEAVMIEKRMMFIILAMIVAVAAFNLVSTLVMTVTDKQADIAILRTQGASPRSIMAIFVVQGAVTGFIGVASGLALGLLIAFHVDPIVAFLEWVFHTQFLPASVYLIHRMPSDPRLADIATITVVALVLSLLATLYPSWRAARVQPAAALRYE
ncbi:lipoprotein-releasing system transmembrane protein LolC [mine drainage metagenome]|jgi:lipoprotein-releasing system permease protein|uniref:Lipoprotein-releasing system transmembrane protein LolC n=1 Tax=mine drainage metagenome TaxID=410659 RepID=A0A1J5PVX9_9ZZZZ